MPIPTVRIECDPDQVFCPFTGQPVLGDNGVNSLPTLLFAYFGDAGEYGYVSERLVSLLQEAGVQCSADDLDMLPKDVADQIDLKGCFMLEIDQGWNGVNSYCFGFPEG